MLTDAQMVRDIGSWPRWPWLPVKRNVNGDVECAVVHADKETRVYIANLGDVPRFFPRAEYKFIDYPTVEALLEVWRID